jgi:hypothetical protein
MPFPAFASNQKIIRFASENRNCRAREYWDILQRAAKVYSLSIFVIAGPIGLALGTDAFTLASQANSRLQDWPCLKQRPG